MKPWLDDGDVRAYHGHVLDVLRGMPDASVDCIITSPPYYGLRDYGTGTWEGGDAACDHARSAGGVGKGTIAGTQQADGRGALEAYRHTCGKCGARRVDQQIGLEPSLAEFVTTLVGVFREARRVLADHGTCWINLGDSYAGSAAGAGGDGSTSGLRRDGRPEASRVAGALAEQERRLGGTQPAQVKRDLPAKNLLGVPWRVALALQDDGWILRRDVIWAKPNPMPESATDRCTSAHEYVFHLTKRPRYWYDADAVREAQTPDGRRQTKIAAHDARAHENYDSRHGGDRWPNPVGRNLRSVWWIATQPTPEAHFATYPEELVRRCLLAGCPLEVCRVCGKPRERLVEREYASGPTYRDAGDDTTLTTGRNRNVTRMGDGVAVTTLGWSDCGHGDYRRGVVLDPFLGSGTTALVARKHGRHAIGVDLNAEYLAIAAKRLQQLSLLGGEAA